MIEFGHRPMKKNGISAAKMSQLSRPAKMIEFGHKPMKKKKDFCSENGILIDYN